IVCTLYFYQSFVFKVIHNSLPNNFVLFWKRFKFRPFVLKCTAHKHERVRVITARFTIVYTHIKHNTKFFGTFQKKNNNNNGKKKLGILQMGLKKKGFGVIDSTKRVIVNTWTKYSQNDVHGKLLQIESLLYACYQYLPLLNTNSTNTSSSSGSSSSNKNKGCECWILDNVLPALLPKMWLLQLHHLSALAIQTFLTICFSICHRLLALLSCEVFANNSNDKGDSRLIGQKKQIADFLIKCRVTCIRILGSKECTNNSGVRTSAIESRKKVLPNTTMTTSSHWTDEQITRKENIHDFMVGGRKLRSIACQFLATMLLLSPYCGMEKHKTTQLLSLMLDDWDPLVIRSLCKTVCEILTHHSTLLVLFIYSFFFFFLFCLFVFIITGDSLFAQCNSKSKLGRFVGNLFEIAEVGKMDGSKDGFNKNVDDLDNLWKSIHELVTSNTHLATRMAALELLGTLTGFAFSQKDFTDKAILFSSWISVLNTFSTESTAEELRGSCVTSIQYSNIFSLHLQGALNYNDGMVDLWIIVIQLLQDFEAPIRHAMSSTISFLFQEYALFELFLFFNSCTFIPNYAVNLSIQYVVDKHWSAHLLKKLIVAIENPGFLECALFCFVFYLLFSLYIGDVTWIFENDKTNFKLFLPERPNDSLEPILILQMLASALSKKIQSIKDFDNDVLNVLTSTFSDDKSVIQKFDELNTLTDKLIQCQQPLICYFDSHSQAIWNAWFVHWIALIYWTRVGRNFIKTETLQTILKTQKRSLDEIRKHYSNAKVLFCEKLLDCNDEALYFLLRFQNLFATIPKLGLNIFYFAIEKQSNFSSRKIVPQTNVNLVLYTN
ncbi:hypothetical protein RFI_15401, partial [Reticulomyxa filosa]